MKGNRNIAIDILKGIGIILVVVGHSGCPKLLNELIYSFHMPLFLIASGYFFSDKYIETILSVKQYAKKKLKTLYLPYLKYSLIFLVAHNLFFKIGLINTMFGDMGGVNSELYTIREIIYRCVNITFRMGGYEPFLLGAYWFMRALFLGCICLCFFSYIINKVTHNKQLSVFITSFLFCMIAGFKSYLSKDIPFFPGGGYPELMSVFFIGVGYFIRHIELNSLLKERSILWFSSMVFIIVFLMHPSSLKTSSNFVDWAAIIFSGTCGFILIHYSSKKFQDSKIGLAIASIGRNSFYILTFHFLMFKPASLLKVHLFGLNPKMVGCHPIIFPVEDNWFWIVYSFTSILLCILTYKVINRVRQNGFSLHY